MTQDQPARPGPVIFTLGLLCLLFSTVFALAMVVKHVGGLELPGCGAESACDQITSGPWGKVPGLGYPISHVGAAWFLALMAAWIATRGALPAVGRWLVRLGVVGSLVFLGVMAFVERQFCPYCVAIHAGNIAFWILLETGGRRFSMPSAGRALIPAAAMFVVATATLAFAETRVKDRVTGEREKKLAEDLEGLKGGSEDPGGAPPSDGGFSGRYRIGPEEAQVRIVIVSDYQCPDCYKIETQLDRIIENPPHGVSVSFAAKQFPFCTDCNQVPSNLHPNACWAARAAEAAGRLGGTEAFWKMHQWLFSVKGRFETQPELAAGVNAAGLGDRFSEFTAVMNGDEVMDDIQADIAEAKALGLFFTPMVFINGHEMRGIFAANALERAVEEIAAANPPARSADYDNPPLAAQSYVDDWQSAPVLTLPGNAQYVLGPKNAPVRIVVYGDHTSSFTARVGREVKKLMKAHPDISYEFRHYPMDMDCNPRMRKVFEKNGCLGSRAAEAAGQLGGGAALWQMHEWIVANRTRLNLQAITDAAVAMGLDRQAFTIAIDSPAVDAAIQGDIRTAGQIRGNRGAPRGYPAIIINERYAQRWLIEGAEVLRMMTEAARLEEKNKSAD